MTTATAPWAQNGEQAKTQPRTVYLEALARRVLVFDGAMGTSCQDCNLSASDFGGKEGCNDVLVVTRPDVIEGIHASFLAAGCDVIETDTFGGSRLKLDEYGLGERTHEINQAAAQLARRVADRFSTPEQPRFVAGSLGPTGMLPSSDDPTLGNITFQQLTDIFAEQARALVEGGVDLLIIETTQDMLELKAAIAGIDRLFRSGQAPRVPIQAQVTLDTTGRMLLGTDIAAALATLEALPVDVIGLNCSTGPEHMREPVRYLGEFSTRPIAVIPNAGLPHNVGGKAVYPMEPEPMAAALLEFVEQFGVGIVGGCCGSTPAHIAALVAKVGVRAPRPRPAQREPLVSGGIRAVALRQDPPPLLVGERVNSQGSRKVKRLLLADDYDGLLQVARQQVEGGAHVLDVCVALTERADEAEQMRVTVKKLAAGVEAPLVIDSTEYGVIRAALDQYPGRAIVNSINLENGRERIDNVLPIVREHGAAVVALTIDEQGMAKTAERKLAVARRIHQIATTEYELPPDALIFDALTFTLATGEQEFLTSAIETIEGIKRIKAELPGVLTILGVSNVSFGLSPHARAVLNSVFLHHAVQAGLDAAIVHPAEVTPYAELSPEQRELAEALIYNRDPDALSRFIAYFEAHGPASRDDASAEDPLAGLDAAGRIHYQILHRKKDGIEAQIDAALRERTPVQVLNEVLLPAMKEVGDKFGAGELILPFVLQSAEVMKKAVAHLEQFLEKKEGYSKGKIVLATVYGDVHDIGKNLVNTILTNNGYSVVDLGKQVPINRIIDTAIEVNADAIGLSALLVSTSKQMPACVQELEHRGLRLPVLIGGAAINRSFGRRAGVLPDGQPYAPGVFYARDAFEGLDVMDKLTDAALRDPFTSMTVRAALAGDAGADAKPATPVVESTERGNVDPNLPIPSPPFWGVRVMPDVRLEDVFNYLDLKTLYRLHWGAKGVRGADWDRLLKEQFEPLRARLQREASEQGWLEPRVVYGYFPCQSDGNQVVVYDPAEPEARRELTRFSFPRQPDRDRLCLSDYFASADSGRLDVLPLQVVTVGRRASTLCERLQAAGNYTDSYFVHGLSVQSAEALAEYAHVRIRAELGIEPEQGKRYSWGYPACPDLDDHVKLFEVLPATETIGVELTSAYQLVPEQSTAALVVHHPQAKYYSTRPAGGLRSGANLGE